MSADLGSSDDFWFGDIMIDLTTGIFGLKAKGSGEAVGVGDRCWAGGTGTGFREPLERGGLGAGGHAGFCGASLWHEVSWGRWDYAFCI